MSGKPKFTPGPWRVSDDNSCTDYSTDHLLVVADDVENEIVSQIAGVYERSNMDAYAPLPRRAEANACLIAAAPDLHEALKAIQLFCDDPTGGDDRESLAMGLSRLLPAARAALAKAEGREPSKDPRETIGGAA